MQQCGTIEDNHDDDDDDDIFYNRIRGGLSLKSNGHIIASCKCSWIRWDVSIFSFLCMEFGMGAKLDVLCVPIACAEEEEQKSPDECVFTFGEIDSGKGG